MRPSLIIRLAPDPQEPVQWLRLDEQGQPQGRTEQGSLAGAAEAARGRAAVGLLPGLDVLLTAARIPTQSRQRLLQAVPYALEEHVSGDVEDHHFAVGPRRDDDQTAVAVVAREVMDRWQAAAEEAGLRLDQLYPDVLTLPISGTGWTLLLEEETFLLRTGPYSGFAGDRGALKFFIEGALEDAGDERPQALAVYHTAPLDEQAELALDLPLAVERHLVEDATELLARHLTPRQNIPLLTGRYTPVRQTDANWRRWKVAAGLLAAWVLVDTGGALLEQWRLSQQYEALHSQVIQVFRDAFPGTSQVLYPRQQMENRLKALQAQGAGDAAGLLPVLDKVGPAVSADPSVQITGLRFRGNELDLELTAADLQRVDQLKQRLEAAGGLRVEIRSAQTEGQRVEGSLHIEVAS